MAKIRLVDDLFDSAREVFQNEDRLGAGIVKLVLKLARRIERVDVHDDEPGAQDAIDRDGVLQNVRHHHGHAVALLQADALQPGSHFAGLCLERRDRSSFCPCSKRPCDRQSGHSSFPGGREARRIPTGNLSRNDIRIGGKPWFFRFRTTWVDGNTAHCVSLPFGRRNRMTPVDRKILHPPSRQLMPLLERFKRIEATITLT